jgi:hypothetical protein
MHAFLARTSKLLTLPAAALLLFGACSDGEDSVGEGSSGTGGDGGRGGLTGGRGGTSPGAAGQDVPGAAGGDNPIDIPPEGDGAHVGELRQLAVGQASMIGVTNDAWVIYRDADSLRATVASKTDEIQLVSETPGSVVIKNNVVFNWADVDWEENVGDLSVWTLAGGSHEIGETRYSEALVSASDDGAWLAYPANTSDEKTDLVLASNDFSVDDVLLEDMGLGGDETCSPSLGFVGSRLFVSHCAPGSRDATLERFEHDGEEWRSTVIAEDALSVWSTDQSGERIFYQGNDYAGYYTEGDEAHRIDAGVSRAFLFPDGSAVLYTVGDQLRRSTVPEANPIPIVTTGFSEPVAFTADYGAVLYSSKVTYESGTQRDLRFVTTTDFEPQPVELVAEPVASLGRSSMTEDGQFVLYLTDVGPRGGTLHAVGPDGTEARALEGVLDVVAARGSAIVFTDGGSDPEVYPVVADLKYLDLSTDDEPVLVEAQILEPKGFRLDAARSGVAYVRSGLGRDTEDPASQGMFWRDLL